MDSKPTGAASKLGPVSSIYTALPVTIISDTISRWSILSGVYAMGSTVQEPTQGVNV